MLAQNFVNFNGFIVHGELLLLREISSEMEQFRGKDIIDAFLITCELAGLVHDGRPSSCGSVSGKTNKID